MESRRADNILLSPAIAIQKVCVQKPLRAVMRTLTGSSRSVSAVSYCAYISASAQSWDELVRVCVLQSVAISFRLGSQLAAFVCLCNECQPLFYTKPSR